MFSDAALAEMGLMPRWRSREMVAASPALASSPLSAIPLVGHDGSLGWAVNDCPLKDDAARLFAQILRAMQLQPGAELQVDLADLPQTLQAQGVEWLWVMSQSGVAPLLQQYANSAQNSTPSLPVILHVHPQDLLRQPLAKQNVWRDWCRWQASRTSLLASITTRDGR